MVRPDGRINHGGPHGKIYQETNRCPAEDGDESEQDEQSPRDQTAPRTKQSAAIAMLRSPRGTTIDGLMKATGWQQHSVRGFLAGVVRKRLRLNLNSSLVDGRRVYRVRLQGPNAVQAEEPKS